MNISFTQLNLINKNNSFDMKEKYKNSPQWRNYASKICKNPFVKQFLFDRQGGRCPFCGEIITKRKIVHHLNYKHTCKTSELIKVKSPTKKKPDRNVFVPDCERCSKETPRAFKKCMKNLRLVHALCNRDIEILKEETGL